MSDLIETMIEILMVTPTADGWGAPAMFWGPPGVGKTKRLRRIAQKYNIPLFVLPVGAMGEGAFGVTPAVDGVGKKARLRYPAPAWADLFEDEDGLPRNGMLFVDEFTTAAPALQPPLLGLVQERTLGDHYLGDRVRVFGAGNPPDQAAAGYDISLPQANRMGHYNWDAPSQSQWSDHMLNRGMPLVLSKALGKAPMLEQATDLVAIEKLVAQNWQTSYAKSIGLVTAFTARRPELLHKMPPKESNEASRGWCSPRSWDLATAVDATATILGADDMVKDTLMAGFIGNAATTEFIAFRASADLPDPERVLDGSEKWAHNPDRPDRTMAVLSACASLVVGTTDKAKQDARGGKLWSLIGTVLNDAVDCGVPAARVLANAKLGRLQAATPVLVKLRPVMEAAGIKA